VLIFCQSVVFSPIFVKPARLPTHYFSPSPDRDEEFLGSFVPAKLIFRGDDRTDSGCGQPVLS
jgi:hypothetical protein